MQIIKHLLKTIKIPKAQFFFLLLTSSIILFLALILANGLIGMNKGKNNWYQEHDYYRQIIFNDTSNFDLDAYTQRKISFRFDSLEFDDSKKDIIIANYSKDNYFFDSDLNSGFKIIGNQPKKENEIIVSYDFYTTNELDLKNFPKIYLSNNIEYIVVGYFNSHYTSYLRSSGYYFDIIKKSNFYDDSYIITVELYSFNDVLNSKFKNYAITFEKEIKNANFYFTIISIVLLLFFMVIIIVASMSCLLTSLFLITENQKSIFILFSLGMRKKYFTIFSVFFVLFFLSVSIIISVFIELITNFILKYYSKEIIFGTFNIIEFNLSALILVFFTAFIMYFLTIISSGKIQIEKMITGE